MILCATCIFGACVFLLLVHKPLLTAMSLSGESYRIGVGMLLIYSVIAIVRMCNWTRNDTFRSAGDAAFGTIMEIAFMYAMVLPCVCLAGMVFHLPFLAIFVCCYVDEPIRLLIMWHHMNSGKWIKPVTEEGKRKLEEFRRVRGLR